VRTLSFSVNWDYRCPFARNAHEHVLCALEAGAGWDVQFVPFSLSQAHVPEGGTAVWDDPAKKVDLMATEAALVVRDRMPGAFRAVHSALFRARHEDARDLREEKVVREVLAAQQADPDEVFEEVDKGWPLEVFRRSHEEWVERYAAFGVPTFVFGDEAAFVRVTTRPDGDDRAAVETITRVSDLVGAHPELNEVKHTRVPR
jgi:protein-disulfide isomerase-like protein with CxxC motif